MVFSDTATYLGVVQDIDFLLFGDSVSTSPFLIADKTRCINLAYDKVVNLILKADGRWEWDDNAKTDLPIATTSLVADQQDYAITGATFLRLLKVELKDSSGNWSALKPISLDDKRNESITDYQKTSGTPREYDKLGNSVFLYPKPSYSQAASLKVFYSRNATHFVAGDTTAVPGFAENFHRLLSYNAALDYAIAHSMNGKVQILVPLITAMESELVSFYASRMDEEKVSLKLEHEDFGTEQGDDFAGVNVS